MAAISVGQIEAVATLKDDLTGKMSGIRKGVLAASAAIGAAGLKAGAQWDKAKATIAKGTGATGDALKGLTDSYRNLAGTVTGPVADAIADLNTHTGLTGKALEDLATKALKAGVDTNAFGSTVRQMGLDGAGAAKLLDQLTKVSQDTGVSVEELTLRVGRNAKRFQDAGGTMSELVDVVADTAYQFGPQGLAGNMAETMKVVNQGVIPSVISLDDRLGDVTGTVEATYDASLTLSDRFGLLKERMSAMIGPAGNTVGALGSIGAAMAGLGPMLPKLAKGARALWTAMTGPVGLVVAAIVGLGLVLYKFRRLVGNVLSSVLGFMGQWADNMIAGAQKAFGWIPGLDGKLDRAREAVKGFTEKIAASVDAWGEAEDATDDAAHALDGAADSFYATATAAAEMSDEAKAAAKATADLARAQELLGDDVGRTAVALQHAKPDIIRTVTAIEKAKEAAEVAATGFRGLWESLKGNAGEILGNIANSLITGAGTMKEKLTDLGNKAADWLGLSMAAGLAAIPVVGPFLAQLGPSLAAGIKKIGKSIWGGVKKLFGKGGDEANRAAVAAARKTAAAVKQEWMDTVVSMASSILGAHETAAEAGQQAYDEMYEAMIEAGWAEHRAITSAGVARQNAITAALQAQKDAFVRQAAFEAALEAIRSGNAAGAAEAARKAAEETSRAWEVAMGAVGLANEAANAAMQEGAAATAAAAGEAATKVSDTMTEASTAVEGAVNSATQAANSMTSAIDAIPSQKTVSITVQHHTAYSSSGSSGNGNGNGDNGESETDGAAPLQFRYGTGGIRDWGTSGTPARLHGKEAVMTEATILKMIAAAGSGGGGGGGQDVVVNLDGEAVGRLVMRRIGGIARGRGY